MKPKSSENLAKDVETRQPMPQPELLFAIPKSLQQAIVQALLTSSPRQLSVSDINKMCNALERLRPITLNRIPEPEKKTNKKET